MAHDYHGGLPGYSPEQILHDGCQECEERSVRDDHGISGLDMRNFAHAWGRAAEWNRSGLRSASFSEMPMLRVLWAVQVQLERYGQPIGDLPILARSDGETP